MLRLEGQVRLRRRQPSLQRRQGEGFAGNRCWAPSSAPKENKKGECPRAERTTWINYFLSYLKDHDEARREKGGRAGFVMASSALTPTPKHMRRKLVKTASSTQ